MDLQTNLNKFGLGVTLGISQQLYKSFDKSAEELGENEKYPIFTRNLELFSKEETKNKKNMIIISVATPYQVTEEMIENFKEGAKNMHYEVIESHPSSGPIGTAMAQNKDDDRDIRSYDIYGFSVALILPEYLQDDETYRMMTDKLPDIKDFDKIAGVLTLRELSNILEALK